MSERNATVGSQTGQRLVAREDARWQHAAPHLLGFLPIPLVFAVTGRLPLAAAVLIPLGPILIGRMLGSDPVTVRHRREATGAAVTVTLAYLLIALALWLASTTPVLLALLPVFGLAIPILTIAWTTLALTAAARALRGVLMTYPYILKVPTSIGGR